MQLTPALVVSRILQRLWIVESRLYVFLGRKRELHYSLRVSAVSGWKLVKVVTSEKATYTCPLSETPLKTEGIFEYMPIDIDR